MKRKVAGILMAGILLIGGLTGCGSSKEPDDYVTNEGYETLEETGTEKEVHTSEGIGKENVKVGVLYLSDPSEGSGYSYTHDLGIIGMQSNLGLTDEQIERKIVDDGDKEATQTAIKECIDDGCNIIFTTSWGYMEATAEMAEEYPDVYFSHGTGYMSNGKNFNNYFGRIYQARYLSGIVAGMNTTSNKIGYVAAQDTTNSEVTGGIDAFAIGVASVNPDAKIYVSVTNSWYAPEKEEAAARKLLDMGCDVMAQHCDTPYPLTLAQEYGVYGIGYNSDMRKEVPDACLCSVLWNWSAYYTQAVNSVIEGTWDGENYFGGMKEGLVGITDLADFCAEGTQEKVDEATSAILSGNNHVFDGELKTNTGEVIGSAGTTLDDETITGKINWYYENVVVVE
ncbi:BMP family ABC transporter substrate-binding protein [Roseburia hominis]|uniref:BMP family ABC transporter substrate-binding protein n=1 Tax=Roseburia hominis TaxID=301301 RepID=UPI001F2E58D4|nr:BMP family ABC transporter substrate-binding protein [Roseburia hominis]MCI5712243.1 BMP family ABC transporter substrate-binding protein [Lachnospiraceae bacterium]